MPGGHHRVCCCQTCQGPIPYEICAGKNVSSVYIAPWRPEYITNWIDINNTIPSNTGNSYWQAAESIGTNLYHFNMPLYTSVNLDVWRWNGVDTWTNISKPTAVFHSGQCLKDTIDNNIVFIGGCVPYPSYPKMGYVDSKIRTFDGANWVTSGQSTPQCETLYNVTDTANAIYTGIFASIYDPIRDNYLCIESFGSIIRTWSFNISTKIWTLLNSISWDFGQVALDTNGNIQQVAYGLCYDAKYDRILFAVYQDSGVDIYKFNLGTNAWNLVASVRPVNISGIQHSLKISLTYNEDEEICYLIISGRYNEFYQLDNTVLTYYDRQGGIYEYSQATYDAHLQRIVFLINNYNPGTGRLPTIANYDYVNKVVENNYNLPTGWYGGFRVIYDKSIDRTILYGASLFNRDTLDGKPWYNQILIWNGVNFDTPYTTNLRIFRETLCYDDSLNRIVVIGGKYDLTDNPAYSYRNAPDVWILSEDHTTFEYVHIQPNLRFEAESTTPILYQIVYLVEVDRYLLLTNYSENAVWEYNKYTNSWTRYFPDSVPAMSHCVATAYHPIAKNVHLYIGNSSWMHMLLYGGYVHLNLYYIESSELWRYDYNTHTFTRISQIGPWLAVNIPDPGITRPNNSLCIKFTWCEDQQCLVLTYPSFVGLYVYCNLDSWAYKDFKWTYLAGKLPFKASPCIVSFDGTIHAVLRGETLPASGLFRYKQAKLENLTYAHNCLLANVTGITFLPCNATSNTQIIILEDNSNEDLELKYYPSINPAGPANINYWRSLKPVYKVLWRTFTTPGTPCVGNYIEEVRNLYLWILCNSYTNIWCRIGTDFSSEVIFDNQQVRPNKNGTFSFIFTNNGTIYTTGGQVIITVIP